MEKKIMLLMVIIFLSFSYVSAITIDSVSTTPSEIAPGDVSIIEFGIKNNGETDIKDVSVMLDLEEIPFAPHTSSTEFNIDEIKDGKTKYTLFKIKALNDAKSGIYKIPIKAIYKEDEETKEINSLISLTVNSKPIISGNVEEGLLLKGVENEVSIKIVNKGLSDIKFLEVEVNKANYYTLLSPKSEYIGDLDSDDFESAEFKIHFKSNSPTNARIPLVIKYKDVLNNEYEESFNLEAKVYNPEQAIQLGLIQKNNTTTYIAIAIILIIIYIIYRRIKKYLKRKKEKES